MAEQRCAAAFAQQRLWLLQELDPQGTAYHVTEAFTVTGPLDVNALSRAANELCTRHEVLRTRFEQTDGVIVQVIADPGSAQARPGFELTRLRVAGRSASEAVRDFHRSEMRRPFSLASGPLLRLHVGELGADEHVVVVTAHHIVCDGWSMGLLLRELSVLYRQFACGEPSNLSDPELQYADYAAWEREWLDEGRTEECLRHWRSHLAGAPASLSLPADRPRGASHFPEAGVHEFTLPAELTRCIGELARGTRSTRHTVLLAAFQAFLAKVSGEQDIVVGCPVSGRGRAGTESLFGVLVNTLPLRADLSDDPAFTELVGRARSSVLDGQEYGELPFERIVEELNPERVQGVNPLFQVMFQLLEGDFGGHLPLAGTRTSQVRTAQPTTFVDLALDMYADGERLRASFNYSRELFDEQTAARLAECFLVLLAAAVEAPGTTVSRLPLLSAEAEAETLRSYGWGPGVQVPAGETVLTALDAQIAERPGDVAVSDARHEWTYQEFGDTIASVARALRAAGVGPGDRVGLLAGRSGLLPAAMFGVLRAGAVLVPLDPANPADRLRAITSEASVRMLLTDADHRTRAAALGLPLLDLADAAAGPHDGPGPGGTAPRPDDPAYIVFTSGSTSTPKGVVVRHGALANLLHSHRGSHYARMAAACPEGRLRVAFTLSVAFDASWDQLLWMVDGHLLHVVDDDTARDARSLLTTLREREVDVLEATPSFLEQLVGLGLFDGPGRSGPWLFVLGGEAMRPSLWARLASEPGVLAVNLYGPTEFTVDALGAAVTSGSGPVVGTPLANCRAMILDGTGRPVPPGVSGEICLSGPQLAVGYLNDPVRTAESFVPDPYAVEPGQRMYRTGDLGRFRPDGQVEYLGRADGQLKVRGYRIDPGEVESALLSHALVRDAAVVAPPDAHGRPRLAGYVVADEGLGTRTLREHLAARLPDYMVPAAIVRVAEVPRNVSGKIATALLPAPAESALRAAEFAAPVVGTETELAEIFSEVLGIADVGRFDDFFRLGGHSLSAVQLLTRIRGRLGVEVPLRTLFETPTVAGLAATLDRGTGQQQTLPVFRGRDMAVASTAQQRLWFLQQVAPGGFGYNMVEALTLRGRLSIPVLAAAIRRTVARHDVLRSRFELGDHCLRQTVEPHWGQDVTVLDLTDLPLRKAKARAAAHVQEVGRRVYDLATGPLFEASVLALAPDEHVLVFGVHHIVCDGWSVRVLLAEVSAHYRDIASGRATTLPEPLLQYQDFAAWEREPAHEARLDGDLAYWRAELAGAPAELALRPDRLRPPVHSGRGETVHFEVPPDVTAELTELAHAHRTTLFSVLLAAFQAVLARWTGQQDLLVGVPVAGRTRPELEDLIGLFVNILPIRGRLDDDPTFTDFLDQVRDTALSGYAHQAAPFERLVELVNPERDLGRNPLVQATCQLFEDSGAGELRIDGVVAESQRLDIPSSRFDISLDLTRQDGGLAGELCYDTDLFGRETMSRLAAAFATFLREVRTDPCRRVRDVPLPPGCDAEPLASRLGAVEKVLLGHPQIAEAAVVAHREPDGGSRVVAHLVPASGTAADDVEAFMETWRFVFESTYTPAQEPPDAAGEAGGEASLLGWTDSFTGEAIPACQMDEWVANTVNRVSALAPRRLLEIGAGTGLLVRPLCAQARPERYVATDYADSAVDMLHQVAEVAAREGTGTEILVRKADALTAGRAVAGPYDTVVVNSVAQYFPSLVHLKQVIDHAVAEVDNGGHVFLGDLRNSALREAFLVLREHRRAAVGTDRETVRDAVERGLQADSELSVDPCFFQELVDDHDRITAVEIAPRRGTGANEMALFRYDVVLHVGCPPEDDPTQWDTDGPVGAEAIARRLAAEPEAFAYRQVANARLTEALSLRDFYGLTSTDDPGPASAQDHEAVDPEELWRLGELHGRAVRVGWARSGAHGTIDVVCRAVDRSGHYTLSEPLTARPTGQRVRGGTPPRGVLAPRLEHALTESLRRDLIACGLEDKVIPRQFVFHAGPLDCAAWSV
ncbi:non-ribosomal peptide synthetase [Streptomyces apocyni]|uniref:non-ribosomal peptide synthetase n=1 Tax=Streptomyces apocyni TaxID=2654677 RepID=UPI0012EA62F4|nr:non-ribosomal peptide synthetase [Streptomyces apocyni]